MTRLLATAITLFFVAIPASAHAKPKVALAPLDGDSSGDVMDAVADALDGGELTVITPKQFSRALDKLGLDAGELKERDLRKLSGELEADAIVQTSLSSHGSNKVLHVKLYAHNHKVKGFKVEFANVKSAKFKSMLHDKMLEKLGVDAGSDDKPEKAEKAEKPSKKKKGGGDDDAAAAAGDDEKPAKKGGKKKKGGDDDAAADDKPEKAEKSEKAEKAEKASKKKKGSSDDDTAAAGGDDDKPAKKKKGGDDDTAAAGGDDEKPAKKKSDDDSAGDDDKPRRASKRAASDDDSSDELHGHADESTSASARPLNRFAVSADAGVSATSRNLTFNSRPNLANPPPGYKNSVVPGARIEASVYPLALTSPQGIASGLGFAVMYDKTLSLSLKNSAQPGTTFPANEQRYGVGPRFRYVFGESPTAMSLTVGLDYGHRTFTIDRAALMAGNVIDVPDVDYRGWTPSVELRVPVASSVALFFGGGAMLMTGAGGIQSNTQYGKAKVTEGEGRAGFDVYFMKRFAVRVAVEFAQVGFQFTGTGQQAINRDMDPTTPDVGGAADRYIGGAATFVVLY